MESRGSFPHSIGGGAGFNNNFGSFNQGDQIVYNLGLEYLKSAKRFEQNGDIEQSYKFYREAANKFLYLIKNEAQRSTQQEKELKELTQNAIDNGLYMKTLVDDKKQQQLSNGRQRSQNQQVIGLRLCGQNYMEAYNFYMDLGEYYFQLVTRSKGLLPTSRACYYNAAQNLNAINQIVKDDSQKLTNKKKLSDLLTLIEGMDQKIKSDIQFDAKSNALSQYDAKERQIIEAGSLVRGGNFEIWSPEKGIINIFSSEAFEDKDGLLKLSCKQLNNFGQWVRPIEVIDRKHYINGRPDVATGITGFEIMQRKIGDCSVLSSLAVAAHYELKMKYSKRLVSCLIFPQDKNQYPIYNPSGKYVVKLFINGIWRAVEVDDYLPVDKNGNFVCAYSNKGKLWVSLIEKAYLKVHGGYEFIGSNSSRDLYTLTGWLPEKIDLKSYNKQRLWERIMNGYRANDCLITIGTGLIVDEDAIGLVSNHAYGVLEIYEINTHKILLVKNPWGHFRWNGRFSTEDRVSWTAELKSKLHYEDLAASDNGIFWIDFDSVCEYFESLDINWNPELLVYRKSFFDLWKSSEMSHTQSFSIKDNPQYCIRYVEDKDLKFQFDTIITWVTISKMLIIQNGENEDEEKASDYIAMHAYPNPSGCIKILEDRNAIVKSVYTNEQNYMLYLQFPASEYYNQQKVLNLVLDQHERHKDLYYNIRVVSNCNFVTQRAQFNNLKQIQRFEIPNKPGGGVPTSPMFYTSPQFYFTLDTSKCQNPGSINTVETLITFKSSSNSDVKLFLVNADSKERVNTIKESQLVDATLKSSYYKPSTVHLHYRLAKGQYYTAVVSTFKQEQSTSGQLTFESDHPYQIRELPQEGLGMKKTVIDGVWFPENAGGCGNFGMFDKNPAYAFNLSDEADVQIRLRVLEEVGPDGFSPVTDFEKFQYCVSLMAYRVQANRWPVPVGSIQIKSLSNPALVTNNGKYTNNLSSCVSKKEKLAKGVYLIIPSTFNPQQVGKFEITIYSSINIESSKYQ